MYETCPPIRFPSTLADAARGLCRTHPYSSCASCPSSPFYPQDEDCPYCKSCRTSCRIVSSQSCWYTMRTFVPATNTHLQLQLCFLPRGKASQTRSTPKGLALVIFFLPCTNKGESHSSRSCSRAHCSRSSKRSRNSRHCSRCRRPEARSLQLPILI